MPASNMEAPHKFTFHIPPYFPRQLPALPPEYTIPVYEEKKYVS
jgi:hypothetical protein